MNPDGPVEILLIHRGAVDVGWIEQALRDGDVHHRLAVVGNDAEARAVLRRQGAFAGAPRPGVILLGAKARDAAANAAEAELLEELAADESLAAIPIVVVAASSEASPGAAAATSHALDRLVAHEITPALLARSIGYAIERRRAELLDIERLSSERAMERARFVAAVMGEVTRSLDLKTALSGMARVLVPRLSDAAIIDLSQDDGRLVPFAQAGYTGQLPAIDPGGSGAVHDPALLAISQRSSVWLTELDIDTADARHRVLLEQAAARALFVTPLVARGQAIGTISYVFRAVPADAEARRLAEEVASSAALAIDNMRLFEQAQRAIRGRDELLAIVSHDLRNPINVMALAVSTLEQPDATPRAQTLPRMKRAIKRMEHLIDDLLDVARVDAGTLQVELSPLPLAPVLDEVHEQWRPLCAEKDIALAKGYAPEGLGVAQLDRHRVMQVLSNLIGNAIKFTPSGGSVRVGAELLGPWAKVSVSDTGPGIAPENLPHVFDRFWQKERRTDGLGLGLAIAQGIVQAHGGSIHVESALGEGTSFWFTLRRVGG
ncbi:MAG TPA: hybrid sensor histidine kinase/response regulator [Polyangiaceae bacterium]|nr:hybrid sensor histidine kinase/response regulator [Polyangiaceae bacterium]